MYPFSLLTIMLSTIFVVFTLEKPIHPSSAIDALSVQSRAAPLSSLGDKRIELHRPRQYDKRVLIPFRNGWELEVNEWDFTFPIAGAVNDLRDLHQQLQEFAQTGAANQPRLPSFVFNFGAYRLEFLCRVPIHWSFVARVAQWVLEAASAGWVGLYQITLRNRDAEVEITARLSIDHSRLGG